MSQYSDYNSMTIDYAKERLRRFGETDYAVWGDVENHRRSFEVLTRIGDLRNKSVLDVGCGFGDLSSYLANMGVQDYTGIDISNEFLEVAKRRYPEKNFQLRDICTQPFEAESFDHVFGCGIFSIHCESWPELVRMTIETMFRICRLGVAVNFLPVIEPKTWRISFVPKPIEVVGSVSNVGGTIEVNNTYFDNHFTLYIHKNLKKMKG